MKYSPSVEIVEVNHELLKFTGFFQLLVTFFNLKLHQYCPQLFLKSNAFNTDKEITNSHLLTLECKSSHV
jgi:hypothetical protein